MKERNTRTRSWASKNLLIMNPKIYIHVDMNAFFASIEQRDFPELAGKPIAVTNGIKGSCVITSSYMRQEHLE